MRLKCREHQKQTIVLRSPLTQTRIQIQIPLLIHLHKNNLKLSMSLDWRSIQIWDLLTVHRGILEATHARRRILMLSSCLTLLNRGRRHPSRFMIFSICSHKNRESQVRPQIHWRKGRVNIGIGPRIRIWSSSWIHRWELRSFSWTKMLSLKAEVQRHQELGVRMDSQYWVGLDPNHWTQFEAQIGSRLKIWSRKRLEWILIMIWMTKIISSWNLSNKGNHSLSLDKLGRQNIF